MSDFVTSTREESTRYVAIECHLKRMGESHILIKWHAIALSHLHIISSIMLGILYSIKLSWNTHSVIHIVVSLLLQLVA